MFILTPFLYSPLPLLALTGRCVAQIGFGGPPALVGVVSAPLTSGALFAFVTRQRGIYSLAGEDPSLPSLSCESLLARLDSQAAG